LLFFFFPEGEVLFKELDDGFGISESLLVDVIDFLEGIRECGFSEFTSLLVVVHDFVVEDGEVEGKTKSDWVASVQGLGGSLSKLIVLKGTIFNGIELISLGALGNISVVITNHFVEEGFGLVSGGNLDAISFDSVNNGDALSVKLLFDLLFISTESIVELGVFWVLLDGTDGSNGSSLGTNLVLESNGEKVSLFGSEIVVFAFDNGNEVLDHIVESLGLLGNSGHENILF